MKWVYIRLTFIGVGSVLLIVTAVIGGLWPNILSNMIASQLALSNNSYSFSMWKEPPLPMYMDIYMFNWTNPEDTLHYKSTPYFKEMGPYVFRVRESKQNIVWNENATISFKQRRTWEFIPERSSGSLSDNITNINVVAMTFGNLIGQLVPDWEKPVWKLIDLLIKHEEPIYVTKTVRELLFDGYYDHFLNITNKLKRFIKIKLPFDKFGWFYSRNGSVDYDGIFNMYTGSNDLHQLGNLYAWNYQSRTNYFNGSCAIIKGNTGELMPLSSADHRTLEVFANDICSSITLTRNASTRNHGLQGYYFYGEENVFDNRGKYQSPCYCIKKHCQPSGTRDLSTCRFGAPAFVSYPHFYLADPSYRSLVGGMKPSEDKHRFLLAIEELTGVPLKVNARLQINILVGPIKGLSFYKDLPVAYLPQMWFDQHAEITDDLASQLSLLTVFHKFAQPILFVLCGIGAALLIVGAVMWFKAEWEINRKPLLSENSE